MLLKNFLSICNYALILGIFSLMLGCSKDDDDTVVDTTDPVITITSPTQAQLDAGFVVGSTITVTGTITDNDLVENVRIRLLNAAGVVLVDDQMDNVNHQTVAINESVEIPSVTPPGVYTITIDATDRTGNTSTYTGAFEIRAGGGGDDDKVIFNVTTPESTPEGATVHIAGEFNEWDPGDTDYILTPVEDQENMYTITLDWQEGTEYKFTLGTWDNVEKGTDCEEIENRIFIPTTEGQEIDVTVDNWAGLGPCDEGDGDGDGDGATTEVTLLVTTPETTPEDATVYIAGDFNEWDAANADYLLTPVEGEENVYSITLDLETGAEYKFTLGSWDNEELNADCEVIDNRVFTPATEGEPEEVEATVENWKGYGDCVEGDGATTEVTLLVTTPETTPEDATVYIAGDFNEWDAANADYLLTPVEGEENVYSITLDLETGAEYKFTLGSFDNEELNADCEVIDNRVFAPATEGEPEEVEATVENWKGYGDCVE